MIFYKKNPGDYARATKHLTFIEHGAYNLLLDEYYHSEKPLPADKELLYKRLCARTTEEKWAIDSVLEQFFSQYSYDLLRNKFVCFRQKRADREIVEYWEQCKRNRINGVKGGRPKSARKPTGNPLATQNNPNRSRIRIRIKAEKDKSIAASPPVDLPAWVPESTWKCFVDMRERMRAPLSPHSTLLILNKLSKFLEQGQNLQDVLEQSIMNNWRGIFPLRAGGQNGTSKGNNPKSGAIAAIPGKYAGLG